MARFLVTARVRVLSLLLLIVLSVPTFIATPVEAAGTWRSAKNYSAWADRQSFRVVELSLELAVMQLLEAENQLDIALANLQRILPSTAFGRAEGRLTDADTTEAGPRRGEPKGYAPESC